MPFPRPETLQASAPGPFPAVELFVQRARQAYLGFSPQAEWPHVVRICALVEGLPLALELAAAWVRTIPCGDLARTIETEMAALAPRHRNRPARQRSLDAVMRTSWSMLARDQQQVLAALSVFVGGFSPEAAHAVAEASLRVLSALVDKALVKRHTDGRLGMHELVRQFAHAQRITRADTARVIQHRYSGYYLTLLQQQSSALDGPGELEAEAVLSLELPNLLRAAQAWRADAAAEAVAVPMLRLLMGRGMLRELFEHANRLLEKASLLRPATRAMVLAYRGRARGMLGESAAAEADFDAAIELALERGLHYPLAYARVYRISLVHAAHRFDEALRELRDIEPLLATVADAGISMRARFVAGAALDAMGRATEAEARLREALELARGIGAPTFLATVQSTLAGPLIRQGRFDEAEALLREALALFERIGNRQFIAGTLNTLAVALLGHSTGARAADAAAHAARAHALFQTIGFLSHDAVAADTLGQALAALGPSDEARALYVYAAQHGGPLTAGDARYHLAALELQLDRPREAAALGVQIARSARQHDLGPLRMRASLLAAALAMRGPHPDGAGRRWSRSLLAHSDLEFELKQRAQSLLAQPTGNEDDGDRIDPLPVDAAFAEAADFLARVAK